MKTTKNKYDKDRLPKGTVIKKHIIVNNKKIPTECGFYWARADTHLHKYNYIIQIHGKIPFLKWTAWKLAPEPKDCYCETGNGVPNYIFGDKVVGVPGDGK